MDSVKGGWYLISWIEPEDEVEERCQAVIDQLNWQGRYLEFKLTSTEPKIYVQQLWIILMSCVAERERMPN